MVNGYARRFNLHHQIQHLVDRIHIRFDGGDLRADVAVDAHHFQARQGCGMLVGLQGAFMGHAKLVALEACGNIRVRFRVHVGVDAQTHRRCGAARQGHFIEHIQLGFAFHVEAGDASLQGLAHFCAGFADTRKNHVLGLAPSGQHAFKFATRDDVKTTARTRENLQYGQR